jgi:hypothetical protein
MTILALLVRHERLTRAEFREYYDVHHRALFRSVTPPTVQAGIVRYVQNHAVERSRASDASPYDCITEMTFRDQAAMRAWGMWYESDDGRVLREDELTFMDNAQRRIILCEPR